MAFTFRILSISLWLRLLWQLGSADSPHPARTSMRMNATYGSASLQMGPADWHSLRPAETDVRAFQSEWSPPSPWQEE